MRTEKELIVSKICPKCNLLRLLSPYGICWECIGHQADIGGTEQ